MRQVQEALEHLVDLSARYPATGILVGAPQPTGRDTGKGLCNCAVLIHQGQVRLRQAKSLLPTYDVFDETRHFDPAGEVAVVPFKDEILGISICEDAWYDPELWFRRLYPLDPIQAQAEQRRHGAHQYFRLALPGGQRRSCATGCSSPTPGNTGFPWSM